MPSSHKKLFLAWVGLSFFTLALVWLYATPYMVLATFSYFLLIGGLIHYRQTKIHVPLMLAGMSIDLGLVVFLEITRSAVEVAMSEPFNTLQVFHILASTLTVALYIPVFVLGFLRLKGRGSVAWHRVLGLTALALRTFGWLTMFSLLSRY